MNLHTVFEKEGVKRCPVCGEVIEREIEMPLLDTNRSRQKVKVRCMCKCERQEKEAYENRMTADQIKRRIDRLREVSLLDRRLEGARFSSYQTDRENLKALDIAKKYVDRFGEMKKKGQGLLFYGPSGTGKSYTAACIVNELIDRLHPAIMTSFVKLLGDFGASGACRYDCEDIAFRFSQTDLLAIDDLGAERSTDYAVERVYDIIDSRYRSKLPIILTTNIDISQMKACQDIRYARIYDRIFEMCYPVRMGGMSRRKKEAALRYEETKNLLER